MAHNLALKAVVTPLLIGGASLAGRRWGHAVGGWLVALPLTSGPVAFFLAADHGEDFAGRAAVGMMAGTISQVAFALAYRANSDRRWPAAFSAGTAAFATVTALLAFASWSALATFAAVCCSLTVGLALVRRQDAMVAEAAAAHPPRWDVPARMVLATGVVITITALAPVIGPHLAGLLSPFPVFGAVLAVFTHRTHGGPGASAVLGGLVLGLAAPAVFFLVLALGLPTMGLTSFALAGAAALTVQGATMLSLPAA